MDVITEEEIKMLSESLAQYIELPTFTDLFTLVRNNMIKDDSNNEKTYRIKKCIKCGKYFVVNQFEIINKHFGAFRDDIPKERDWENPDLCRNCGKWSFDSIIDVNLIQNIPKVLHEHYMLEKILKKEPLCKDEIEKIILLVGSEEYIDILFICESHRRYINQLLYPEEERITVNFYETVNFAMNNGREEFFTSIIYLKSIKDARNKINYQRSNDVNIMLDRLEDKYKNGIFDVLYPRIHHENQKKYFTLEEIKFASAKEYLDLYKDLYDLLFDHTVLNYICKKMKCLEYNFDSDEITSDLYGNKLVSKIINNSKDTPLQDIVQLSYNRNMRNGIAHGSYYIDEQTKKIYFYDKGKVSYEDDWENILNIIETLISLHKEVENLLNYIIVLYEDKYLLTSGIYCIQPKFGDDGPEIHLTQSSPFWKKSMMSEIPLSKIYKIDLQKILEGCNQGIRLRIEKESNSKYIDTHYKETKLQDTDFIKKWAQAVVEKKKIEIILIQVMQQTDATREGYGGIEYEIPIDVLSEERMMVTGLYRHVDTIHISEDVMYQLKSLYRQVVKQPRNELCACSSGKKFKNCCDRYI